MQSQALTNALKYFLIQDNELIFGDLPVSVLAEQHKTPFYVYDLAVARKKLERLKRALPAQIEIHYAIKANPHPEVISFFNSAGVGFDVASSRELETAIDAGVRPEMCGFAGPGKSEEEIAFAIQQGIQSLNVESRAELLLANRLAIQLRKKVNVALRLNPPFLLKRAGMQMNGGPSAFGIDTEEIPALLAEIPSLPNITFRGFHIFSGSQNLNAELLVEFLGKAFGLLRELAVSSPLPIQMINLGGGFGIPYFQSDEELDVEFVGTKLAELLHENQDVFAATRFIVETGRYLVGESGIYVSRVRYKKESRGKTFLVVEGGLNHHLAATGNFGQVVRKNYPIAALQKLEMPETSRFNIVGPLCTPLDVLAADLEMPEMEEGELIAVFASGAYGYTSSPHAFLSHPKPKEIVLHGSVD